jgi:hypothetical protein
METLDATQSCTDRESQRFVNVRLMSSINIAAFKPEVPGMIGFKGL